MTSVSLLNKKRENKGIPSESSEDVYAANKLLSGLLNFSGDWILVPNGSFKGYFDWCPVKLRLGPWSPLAPLYIVFLCFMVVYTVPSDLLSDSGSLTFPDAFSCLWYYNTLCFLWMSAILYICVAGPAGPFVFATYTIQSWTMLTFRHGLSALAPFLPSNHIFHHIHEILRFPALASATVTFFVWNFFIAPFLYFKAMESPIKRRNFLRWTFSFKLVQIHFFNIVFAVLNTVIGSPKAFSSSDLWCSILGSVLYSLFYLLVLDRLGVHLYPIFSPRTHFFVLTWSGLLSIFYACHAAWNSLIKEGFFGLIEVLVN